MGRIGAIMLTLALAACAQTREAADWLASGRAQSAVANLKDLAAAVDCGLVAPGAKLSAEIARAVDAGQAAVDRTGRVSAISAALCAALGGGEGR